MPVPKFAAMLLAVLAMFAPTSCGTEAEASPPTGSDAAPVGSTTDTATSTTEAGAAFRFVLERGANRMAPPTCVDAACVFSFSNSPIEVSGDAEGVVVSVGAGGPLADGGFGGTGYAVFTGTITVCDGTGTLAWTDQVVQTADGRVETTWRIVPGSGTEGLAGVTGEGSGTVAESQVAADGSGQVVAEGHLDCG